MYTYGGISHLDIKPQNILMDKEHYSLSDFGQIKKKSMKKENLEQSLSLVDTKFSAFTVLYAPPEVMN